LLRFKAESIITFGFSFFVPSFAKTFTLNTYFTLMNYFRISLVLIGLTLVSCSSQNEPERQINRNSKNEKVDIIESLNTKIVAKPNDPNLYVKRAYAYRDRNMMQLAIRDAERALAIDSTVSFFHTVLGDLQFKTGQLRDARLSLEKAVNYDETNTDALLKLAEANFLLRRYDEAMTYTNDALRIDDKLAQGYYLKGFIYQELGDTTRAKSSFQTVTEVFPDHYEAYMQLGSLAGYQGDPLAVEYFKTALELKPKSVEAWYHLGMLYQAGGKYDEALKVYRKLIEVDPKAFLGYYNTGYIYLTEYLEYEVALAYFDTVVSLEPSYTDAMYNRGVCFEELNKPEQAMDVYKLILEVEPDYTPAARGLERLH